MPILDLAPMGVYFDEKTGGGVEFQANTQKEVKEIRGSFPGSIWTKMWNRECKWWEYYTEFRKTPLKIYGVYEGPATCTPIYKTVTLVKQVPTEFVTKEVEERVIVGFDCGGDDVDIPQVS